MSKELQQEIKEAEGAKDLVFVSGRNLTLRESLEFVDRGSRTPHPGGGNNMTTFLMQIGVPTVMFWEVKADLSGYDLTMLGETKVSQDNSKCGPFAQFDKKGKEKALAKLPSQIASALDGFSTPFQANMAIAKASFPQNVQSSAQFYLDNLEVVEPILRILGESRFAGSFSKKVKPNGEIVEAKYLAEDRVYYQDGTSIPNSEIADGYLRLLRIVKKSEDNPIFNPKEAEIEGVLPDARIMSVLDSCIFSKKANTDRVFGWSGTAMYQYMMTEPDSPRWRETVAGMYRLVRQRAIPDLPERLEFVLIPTQGLGKLVSPDRNIVEPINQAIRSMKPATDKASVMENLRQEISGKSKAEITHILSGLLPEDIAQKVANMVLTGNLDGALGITVFNLTKSGQTPESIQQREAAKLELKKLLRGGSGEFVLQNQPTITPLEYLQGERLYPLEGVMDTPSGQLEKLRGKFQQMAGNKIPGMNSNLDDFESFNRAGWF